MLGGVVGACQIADRGLPLVVGLVGALLIDGLFGWLTDLIAIRRRAGMLARSE